MSVLTGDASQFTVTAVKRSIILTISRPDIIKLVLLDYIYCLANKP